MTEQVRLRAARPAGRHPGVRGDEEPRPGDDLGPRERARWFFRAPADSGPRERAGWFFRAPADSGPPKGARWFTAAAAALITALTVGVVVTVTPAEGAAGAFASSLARAMRNLVSTSRNGQAFAGTPAVGALFTMSGGKLGRHFCTASVISSPHGDLVITAAHCMSGTSGVVFVPGYDRGASPYGVWTVTKVYADRSWTSSSDPDDDVAFLRVGQPGSIVPIEDVTGAEQLKTGTPARQLVEVIGYPDSAGTPIVCRNWTREPMSDQLEFDCGGYTDGTSGGPFLADVNPRTTQGSVIGVIGGYEQGGLTPQVSYSPMFGANVAALYRLAVAGG